MVAWYARRHASEIVQKGYRPLTEGRLWVEIEIVAKALRGDIDNIAKTAFDGLQDGGLIKNDVQIDELRFTRRKGATEQTRITVGHVSVGGPKHATV
jgi:Holliday junction resolvase RusA-like endonuclease